MRLEMSLGPGLVVTRAMAKRLDLRGDEQEYHGHQEALATLPWPGERAGEAFFRKLG